MSKKIGIKGDVKAEPSKTFPPGAVSGSWTAGSIQSSLHDKIYVKNKQAVYLATCTFSFFGNGPPPGNLLVNVSDKVELKVGNTKLNGKTGGVLLDGDSAKGAHGNTLKVVTSQAKFTTV